MTRSAQPDRRPDAPGRGIPARNWRTPPDARGCGLVRPARLATIVFAVILIDEASLPHERTLLLAVVATIGISVFAHGLTAQLLTNRYAHWYTSPRARSCRRWRACPQPHTGGEGGEHRLQTSNLNADDHPQAIPSARSG